MLVRDRRSRDLTQSFMCMYILGFFFLFLAYNLLLSAAKSL